MEDLKRRSRAASAILSALFYVGIALVVVAAIFAYYAAGTDIIFFLLVVALVFITSALFVHDAKDRINRKIAKLNEIVRIS